jgi:hypothetical protein
LFIAVEETCDSSFSYQFKFSSKTHLQLSCNWVFNEADELESSSILIYSELLVGLNTQMVGLDATLIKE